MECLVCKQPILETEFNIQSPGIGAFCSEYCFQNTDKDTGDPKKIVKNMQRPLKPKGK